MASTYSNRLKIELIGSGEQAGSWGTTTNNNFDQSIEQAIAGVLTISTSGSSSLTLTTASGPQTPADNQARQAAIIFGSADQDCTVQFPALEKTYILRNANTAYKITIRLGASGNTFVLLPNRTYSIITNGTNWHDVDAATPTWIEKTSAYTAFPGDNIFVNTNAGAVTITLPTSPTQGDEVAFVDAEGTFDTNNLTVDPGSGIKIMGQTAADTMVVDTNNAAFALVYQDAANGWRFKDK